MARVNIDILGISELKWTGMGEFNSDDHYIYYYCGQESLKRNGVALIANQRVKNAVLGWNLKNEFSHSGYTHHQILLITPPTQWAITSVGAANVLLWSLCGHCISS